MDGWVPKGGGGGGGALPPGDGAFERFLTAAIAAIITIMFSWRLLDDMSEDSNKSVADDEEGRRRRATAYAALALTSPRPPQPLPRPPITDLDIDEGGNYNYYGDDDDDKRAPRDEGSSSAPRSYDSGYQSVLLSGGVGASVMSRSDSSSVDALEEETAFSSLDMMKCFTSAPPVYLPTPDNNNYAPYLPGNTDSPRELGSDREGESPRMEALQTSSDDSSRDLSDSDRELQKDGTTCVDWPPENADDFYNVSGDSDDVQPRELDSDEELYCCSLLEPIIEEDSDDFLSSSGDSNSFQPSIPPPPPPHRPPLPVNHPPLSSSTFARRFATNEGTVGESAVRPPAVEVGQLSKASPQAVLEDVFNPTSPLIPADRGHHSSRLSPDNADDSESDESVQTVIRRGSVPSSGEGSVDSSPLHGPSFLPPTAPESPVCEKRLSSPKRYGGVRSVDIDPGKATYPETTDEVLYSVYEANHPVLYGDDSWRDGYGGVKRPDWTEGGRNSSDEEDNDSTAYFDSISSSGAGIERGDGEVGSGDRNTPVSAPVSAAWVSTTSQPQAPAVFTSELSYPVSTQKDTAFRNPVVSDTDTHREYSPQEGACVETDLDGFITELNAEPVTRDRDSEETETNMERRGKSGAIDSFLTDFEDEPFARRRGRRDRSPKRDTFVDKLERREADTRPTPHPMTDINTRVDSQPGRHVGTEPKITDLDDEPVFRTRRTSDRRVENPSKQSYHPTRGELETDIDSDIGDRENPRRQSYHPTRGELETDIDSDMGDRDRELKPRDPFLVELDEEPFARRWGSGRKSVPVETERRDPPPRKTDDRQSLPVKIEATYSAPVESVMPQDYNFKKPAYRETYARKSPHMETDIDGDDSYSDTRGRDTDTDRDRSVQRGTDSFMTDLEGEPVVRRAPATARSPEDDSLNRSRRSDSGSHRSPENSYSDRRAPHYGKREKDLEPDNTDPYKRGRYDPDLDIDLYKNNRRDSDLDTQSFHSARSETDLDRSVGKKSDKSIDSFLTELDEEPFARRIGRRRGASPERARDREKREKPRPIFQTAPSLEPGPVLSSPTETCPVLELSPTVSQPTFLPQTKPVSPENTVMVSDSPSISIPTAVLSTQDDTRITSTQGDTRITSTPQKPEKGARVAVPESPTISVPPAVEAFPQVRMSYSTTSRIGTSAVLPPPAPPAAAAVEEPPGSGPFADATESSAVEPTPRGYTFTRCESESIRSERRMFLVDKPLAPDFETFINSVPFSSETYAELEDEGSNDFDEYSNFVQNLHRPSCSGAELSAALPLKSPAVDERCILSGNLVSPPNVDVFQFPQAHSTMPAVSSEAVMHRSDSADAGSDSYKAEASSDVLDTSFDIDNTEVREKMETDFAFLQDGNTVRLPPTREEESSKEPRDYGAETSSQQTSEADYQADSSSDRSDDRRDDRRRKRDYSSSRDSDRKRRKSGNEDWSDDDIPFADDLKKEVEIEKRTGDMHSSKLTVDSARPGLGERRDEVGSQRKEERQITPERKDYPGRDKMMSERASDVYSRPDLAGNKLPVQPQSTTRLEDAPTILFFQPASSMHKDKPQPPKDHAETAQPQSSPYSERQEDSRKADAFPFKREPPVFDSFSKPGERGETIFTPARDSSSKVQEKYSPDSRDSESKGDSYEDKDENRDRGVGGDIGRREEIPKLVLNRKEAIENDRRRFFMDISPRTEISPRMKVSPRVEESPRTGESSFTEVSPYTEASPRTDVSPYAEVSPRTEGSPWIEVSPVAESSPREKFLTDTTNFGSYWAKPPIPKPRVMARPTPMPRSKSLGDNIGSPSIHSSGIADDEDVFHGEASDSDTDSHPSLQDDEEEELLFKPQKSTSLAAEEKRPRSLKEIRRIQKSGTRPMIAPFTLPDHIILPSRLKIMASRRQFLSSENLDSSPNTSLHEQFAAHKVSQQQTKERRYKSPNKKFTSPSFSSQDQLEKLNYMLNYSRQSESSFDRSQIDHLHEGCILTPEGRRSILDKTMSIENLQVDLPSHLRRFGSVTSLVETDIDTGETLETNFFPETNLDIFDHLFQSHQPLQRSASMSDLLLNDQRGAEHGHEYGSGGGRGLTLGLPSQTHKSTGKGRFAHRKHHKSKSLCTLETNLDEVGEEGEDPALRRVPSVHELRVTKSLQKLNVPDWFKQSSLSKSSSCLLKYGSSSTMNSFSFSPSLISSPCASTAPPAPNVVIKTRVVPPSNPRALRSPNFASSSAALPSSDRKPPAVPVKLPSEKLREKEKNKNLMPIPIVPFAQIRAMFEKKGRGQEAKKEAAAREAEKTREERTDTKPKVEKAPTVVSRPAVPSISISSEEEVAVAPKEARPTSAKRTLFDKPPISPTRTSPPVEEETFMVTTSSSPISAQPQQSVPRPGHRATNGVSEDLDGHFVPPSTVSPRTEVFPPSSSTGRSHPVTEKPPISPTSAEPKTPWRDSKDSSVKNAPKDSPKDAQPKSPPKDSKQQFSPSRSLRQFFGRSKDKSGSEKKSEGGSSLDSSFSSGDGYYEKEPRRIGGSERSRRSDSNPTGSTPFEGREPRSDHDSSFSSEGPPSGADTSSRSLEGASSRSSRAPQSGATFPASVGSRPTHANSERHQPAYSRFGPQEDSEPPPRSSRTSKGSGRTEPGGAPTGYQRRLPGAGTSYGHLSSSSENGEHVPESVSSASSRPESATAAEEKKSVKETTV